MKSHRRHTNFLSDDELQSPVEVAHKLNEPSKTSSVLTFIDSPQKALTARMTPIMKTQTLKTLSTSNLPKSFIQPEGSLLDFAKLMKESKIQISQKKLQRLQQMFEFGSKTNAADIAGYNTASVCSPRSIVLKSNNQRQELPKILSKKQKEIQSPTQLTSKPKLMKIKKSLIKM